MQVCLPCSFNVFSHCNFPPRQTPSKSLLSIDIGTTNFAFCILSVNQRKVLEWDNISIIDLIHENNIQNEDSKLKNKRPLNISTLFRQNGVLPTLAQFSDTFIERYADVLDSVDWIVIEDQLKPAMRIVQATLFAKFHSYFQYKGLSVLPYDQDLFSHIHKECGNDYSLFSQKSIQCIHPRTSKSVFGFSNLTYAQRKKHSIQLSKKILENGEPFEIPPNLMEFFNNHPKQDDLADSFLQALSFSSKLDPTIDLSKILETVN